MNNNASYSRFATYFLWLIASLFYSYQYVLRVMPGVMLTDIVQKFQIDAIIFGQFSGFYYVGYALMHIPVGIALDRYGPKIVLPICISLTSIGLTPILFSDHWSYAILGRIVTGAGSSAAILGVFKIIRIVFEEKKFTRMLSMSVTIGLIGAIYGGAPISYLCDTYGYQAIVQGFIITGLTLAITLYIIVPHMQTEHQNSSVIEDIKIVLCNRKVLLICCCAGLMVGPLEGFADIWGTKFFKLEYGYDTNIASYLPSVIYMGMCIGAPILGIIAEKTGSYMECIIITAFVMCLVFIVLMLKIMTVSSITISLLIVGMCCSYQVLAIYTASTYVPEHVSGLTTAVANMIIMMFGYVFNAPIGYIINMYGGIETESSFIYGLSLIPIALILSIIGLLYLNINNKTTITK